MAACLTTDAERYTALTETMEPTAVVELINRYFGAPFGPVLNNGGVVSDVKGDGLLAVGNCEYAGPEFKTGGADSAAERATATLIERNWAHGAPIRHDCGVASAQDVGNWRIEFLLSL